MSDSYDLRLWMTLRRYVYTKGQPFLDLLLAVKNKDEFENYHERYVDFDEEFDKHFTHEAYSRSQLGSQMPLVALGFRETRPGPCAPEFMILMNFAFQTISPRDCRDNGAVQIMNTPEGILRYKSALQSAFEDVVCQAPLNIKDLGDDGLPVSYRVGAIRQTPLNQANEMQFGSSTYQVWIKTKC